jgi:hypothetical protein
MELWSRRDLISESRRPRCDQRWVSIFSRAALAKKADRGESARGRCLVGCGEQASVQREIWLNGPARIADERHNREHRRTGYCISFSALLSEAVSANLPQIISASNIVSCSGADTQIEKQYVSILRCSANECNCERSDPPAFLQAPKAFGLTVTPPFVGTFDP